MSSRIEHEVSHGRDISDRAERIWGWDTPAGRRRAARRADFYVEHGGITTSSRVLEIGCGTGLFTRAVARTGARITAMDISPDLITRARAATEASNVEFLVGDAEHLPFEDESFDAVYGSSILHHLDLTAVLPEVRRVLRTGGRTVFTEPNMLNPQIALMKNIKPVGRLLGDTPDETAFFRSALRRAFLNAGFARAEVVPFDFLHPWIPAFLLAPAEPLTLLVEHLPLVREIAGSLMVRARR